MRIWKAALVKGQAGVEEGDSDDGKGDGEADEEAGGDGGGLEGVSDGLVVAVEAPLVGGLEDPLEEDDADAEEDEEGEVDEELVGRELLRHLWHLPPQPPVSLTPEDRRRTHIPTAGPFLRIRHVAHERRRRLHRLQLRSPLQPPTLLPRAASVTDWLMVTQGL